MTSTDLYQKTRELALSVEAEYPTDGRIAHLLILDCSPADLDLDENPNELDVGSFVSVGPVDTTEGLPVHDVRPERFATVEEIRGFVSHARTHKYQTPNDEQLQRLLLWIEAGQVAV